MRYPIVAGVVVVLVGAAAWWHGSSPEEHATGRSESVNASATRRIDSGSQPAATFSPRTATSATFNTDDDTWTPPYWRRPRPTVDTPAELPPDPDARLTLFPSTPASPPPGAETQPPRSAEPFEREEGTLTLQGMFGYRLDDAKTPERSRVTVAGTLDCKAGKGTFSYRDTARRVEWLSSQFAFDAANVCFTDRQNLDALVNRFTATIAGVYSPLTMDVTQQVGEDGRFDIRFISTDGAGTTLRSPVFCVALHGGAYAGYSVPTGAGAIPGCVVLDSFTIQRNKPN
jgi:hypothetical protein